jgi:hypothetical protein
MPQTLRKLSRGTVAALFLVALGGLAVAAPLATVASPQVAYPVARLLPVKVTEAARGATIAALEMDGYEMLPAVTIEQ